MTAPEPPPAAGFDSLAALRAAHGMLLKELSGDTITDEQRAQVNEFLARGAATGRVLADPEERNVAQGILNYWTATLYTQSRRGSGKAPPEIPNALLHDFDEAALADIAARADAALDALPEPHRELAARVLLRLARLDPTTRGFHGAAVPRADLAAGEDPEAVRRVLAALVEAGVVREEADGRVCLRYDALVGAWGRLKEWLDRRLRFRKAAEFWDQSGRKPEALVTGPLLAEALPYRDLSPLEQDFVNASVREDLRQTTERAAAQDRQRELERKEAETTARYLRLWKRATAIGGAILGALLLTTGVGAFQWHEKLQRAEAELAAHRDKEKAEEARKAAEADKARAEKDARAAGETARQAGDLARTNKALADENARKYEESALTARLVSQQPPRSVGWKLWRPGLTLRVRFVGGTPEQRSRVMKWAREWAGETKDGVLFAPSEARDAELRVAFRPDAGTWSYVGTDALVVPPDQPTMNLADPSDTPAGRRAALRHFGLALGLINETANPDARLVWNEDGVNEYYGGKLGMDRFQIQAQVLQHYSAAEFPWYRAFDPASVMMIPIPDGLARRDDLPLAVPEEAITDLSPGDRKFIAALYQPIPPPGEVPKDWGPLAVENFRQFQRYRLRVEKKATYRFRVEIAKNVGFSVLKLPPGPPGVGRPVEVQTLTTPTQKAHDFRLTLDPGDYWLEFYGRLPTAGVTDWFGPGWVNERKPPAGWDGRYRVSAEVDG